MLLHSYTEGSLFVTKITEMSTTLICLWQGMTTLWKDATIHNKPVIKFCKNQAGSSRSKAGTTTVYKKNVRPDSSKALEQKTRLDSSLMHCNTLRNTPQHTQSYSQSPSPANTSKCQIPIVLSQKQHTCIISPSNKLVLPQTSLILRQVRHSHLAETSTIYYNPHFPKLTQWNLSTTELSGLNNNGNTLLWEAKVSLTDRCCVFRRSLNRQVPL